MDVWQKICPSATTERQKALEKDKHRVIITLMMSRLQIRLTKSARSD